MTLPDTSKVTRIEVIDHTKEGTGRDYVKWDKTMRVELDVQDDDQTLKIFLSDK